MNKKRFQPEDMEHILHLSGIAISSDGKHAAYVCAKGDEETGLFLSNVYVVDMETGESVLVEAKGNQTQPQFGAENKLFYLSDESGSEQLHSMDLQTGTTQQLTTARHGVNFYNVSKDGSKVVFELDLWVEDIEADQVFQVMTAEQLQAWETELEYKPYEITDLTYKMDEWFGMRQGQLPRIAMLDVQSGKQTLLIQDDLEAIYPSLSADGSMVAFYGYPHKGAHGRQAELFVMNSNGTNREQLTDMLGVYVDNAPCFTPKGNEIVYTGIPALQDGSALLLPYAFDLETKQIRTVLSEEEDYLCHGLHCFPANRTEYGIAHSYFYIHEDYLYFISAYKGRENIYCKALYNQSKPVSIAQAGDTAIHEFAIAENGTIAFLMANLQRPVELYAKESGKEITRLTNVNAWMDDYELPNTEEFWVKSKDGKTELQVWLVHPVNQEDDRLYPAVLYVRGGPTCTYNADYWHEFHALASAGMAVIYTNPRGSFGYGRDFCAGGIAWAPEAMEDLEVAVEAAIDKGFIDKKRVGITGGSYGGYMTNKFIGRTNYFAAAASQRCLINPFTSYGTGDMGFISANPKAKDTKLFTYLEDRIRGNAITYIDNMKVPLLLLHGYNDIRCSFEQAEQLFVAMKDRNPEVPVRMVMFPGANHSITRTGKLYQQIQHLSELTNWFSKYLAEGGNEHD